MTPGFVKEFEPQCEECHTRLRGWTVTPPPLFFVDKDDQRLCEQMKGFGNDTGAKFVSHIRDDHGGIQFIAAGFAGHRALSAQMLKDYGLKIDKDNKPPGSQLEMTEKAGKWVALMGGNWVGHPSCGCVMPKIEGTFTQVDSASIAGVTDTNKVTGTVVLEPADGEPPAAPSFGDVKSNFFRATGGEVTVELTSESLGLAGSKCMTRGRKSFSIADLPQPLRRYLWLEVADDGRYKLSLGLTDRVWQTWKMDANSVCTFPTGHVARDRLHVNQVALMLGVHQGTLDSNDEISGRLPAPLQQGVRSIDGHWSFARKVSQ